MPGHLNFGEKVGGWYAKRMERYAESRHVMENMLETQAYGRYLFFIQRAMTVSGRL